MNIIQCRMGRAALNWTGKDLADAAGVSALTVVRFEGGQAIRAESLAAMQSAMEAKGVQFARRSARLIVSVPE